MISHFLPDFSGKDRMGDAHLVEDCPYSRHDLVFSNLHFTFYIPLESGKEVFICLKRFFL